MISYVGASSPLPLPHPGGEANQAPRQEFRSCSTIISCKDVKERMIFSNPKSSDDSLAHYQPIRANSVPLKPDKKSQKGAGCCSGTLGSFWAAVLILLALYFLAPLRTNILALGIDRTSEGSAAGRSDIMILTSVNPLKPTIHMLSIPRDLWVTVPGHDENRINTAHFYAEAEQPGSGPKAAMQVVRNNFRVPLDYYVRVKFDGFLNVVDAMGGVTVNLDQPAAGLDAGTHLLAGEQALAFVRDRKSSDDFFRMQHTQLFIKSAVAQMIKPSSWSRIPAVMGAMMNTVDTNIPFWQYPRLGLALVRAGKGGFDNTTLTRDEVTPFVTSGGAQVLGPNWDKIDPIVEKMFGKQLFAGAR